ncbi:MAG: ATP synthase subunit I [Phascolarctobacterium sp.]|nr:ATP synthase subunit I [Phascolarctobacterium sp.]
MDNKTLGLLIKNGYAKIALLPAALGLPIVFIFWFAGKGEWAAGLAFGLLLGFLDNLIMLMGVKKAMPYSDDPKKGFKVQRRYRWARILSAGTLIILLSRQGYNVCFVFIGLVLTHIFLIINFTIIAYQLKKRGT